jgi:hypothetical protein
MGVLKSPEQSSLVAGCEHLPREQGHRQATGGRWIKSSPRNLPFYYFTKGGRIGQTFLFAAWASMGKEFRSIIFPIEPRSVFHLH